MPALDMSQGCMVTVTDNTVVNISLTHCKQAHFYGPPCSCQVINTKHIRHWMIIFTQATLWLLSTTNRQSLPPV